MESLFLPITVFVGIFLAALFFVLKFMATKSDLYTKTAIERIYADAEGTAMATPSLEAVAPPAIIGLPIIGSTYTLFQKSKVHESPVGFMMFSAAAAVGFMAVGGKLFGTMGIAFGLVIAFYASRWFLARKIRKNDDAFLNKFPDALDMIARSVRSGFPLNTALRIIGENMDPPVGSEFKQLVDEITYGRSLPEALYRMAERTALPDVQFFAVVLTVQQETGGSLAEVMTNLSGIIRKRKQLRMKIAALTAEGRVTAIILGGLPILVMGAIQWVNPAYLLPLYETTMGHWLLGGAIGLIVASFLIVNKMIDIDI